MALSVKYLTSSLLVVELESVRIFLDVQVWLQFLDVKGLADLPTKVRFLSTPEICVLVKNSCTKLFNYDNSLIRFL